MYKPNPGHLPRECEGTFDKVVRVHAILHDGTETRKKSPAGWPASRAGACSWHISNPPKWYEIKSYEVI